MGDKMLIIKYVQEKNEREAYAAKGIPPQKQGIGRK
jgi:hypothetical protein